MDQLELPDSKAALIWILGHYSERIENVTDLLNHFLDTFTDEQDIVQFSLLTAVVKLFLNRPKVGQLLIPRVLKMCTEDIDNPDLRDRGFMYWRLLSSDPILAKSVVLSEAKLDSVDFSSHSSRILCQLVYNISTISPIIGKPLDVSQAKAIELERLHQSFMNVMNTGQKAHVLDQIDLLGDSLHDSLRPLSQTKSTPDHAALPYHGSSKRIASINNSFEGFSPPFKSWLDGDLIISGAFTKRDGIVYMELSIKNNTLNAAKDFAIALNKNSFGLSIKEGLEGLTSLLPNETKHVSLRLCKENRKQDSATINNLQVAFKSSLGINYFNVSIPLYVLLLDSGRITERDWLALWNQIPDSYEKTVETLLTSFCTLDTFRRLLDDHNIFVIVERSINNCLFLYCSAMLEYGTFLIELKLNSNLTHARSSIKSENMNLSALFLHDFVGLFFSNK
jgi:hypothetical protein